MGLFWVAGMPFFYQSDQVCTQQATPVFHTLVRTRPDFVCWKKIYPQFLLTGTFENPELQADTCFFSYFPSPHTFCFDKPFVLTPLGIIFSCFPAFSLPLALSSWIVKGLGVVPQKSLPLWFELPPCSGLEFSSNLGKREPLFLQGLFTYLALSPLPSPGSMSVRLLGVIPPLTVP